MMSGPPGGCLARLSRERAQSGVMLALGDGCFRATVVLPHHAAGSWPIHLFGSIMEQPTSMCCGLQHIDVGLFVSIFLSLQRRMRPQDRSASSWLRQLDGAAGLRMVKRVAGVAMAPRPALVSVAWFGTLLRVSVRECEQPFRTYVPYVRYRDDFK